MSPTSVTSKLQAPLPPQAPAAKSVKQDSTAQKPAAPSDAAVAKPSTPKTYTNPQGQVTGQHLNVHA